MEPFPLSCWYTNEFDVPVKRAVVFSKSARQGAPDTTDEAKKLLDVAGPASGKTSRKAENTLGCAQQFSVGIRFVAHFRTTAITVVRPVPRSGSAENSGLDSGGWIG